MSNDFPVYEVRRGWTPQTIRSVAIVGPILIALAVLFVITHQWIGLIAAVFLLSGLLRIVVGGIRKPVALRMDEHGIALSKSFASTPTVFVPWAELHTVWIVWRSRRFNALGVSTTSAPDQPRQTFGMIDWHVDLARITELLAHYAPTATICDRTVTADNNLLP